MRTFESSFYYGASADWKKTESLKNSIAEFREQQTSNGLSIELFDQIVDWKLRKQRARTEKHRETLTEPLWEQASQCAFSVQHRDPDVVASVQVGILSSLPGVGVGLATAILAFAQEVGWPVQKADFMVWSRYDELTMPSTWTRRKQRAD